MIRAAPPLVIVADDLRAIRNGFAALLADAGYQALQAADGEEALDLMRQHRRVDCLVLDAKMPKLDGFGVLDELGLPEQRPLTRILLMDRDPSDAELAARAEHYGVALIEKVGATMLEAVKAI